MNLEQQIVFQSLGKFAADSISPMFVFSPTSWLILKMWMILDLSFSFVDAIMSKIISLTNFLQFLVQLSSFRHLRPKKLHN